MVLKGDEFVLGIDHSTPFLSIMQVRIGLLHHKLIQASQPLQFKQVFKELIYSNKNFQENT
jgi:hypothetical protein